MRKETKAALDNILNCMTGMDGGVQFILFKTGLGVMDERAEQGDKAAAEVIEVVKRFSRLVDVFGRKVKP